MKTLPKRLKWNTDFENFVKELDKEKPVIICGDLNVAHKPIDLKNPTTNTKYVFIRASRKSQSERSWYLSEVPVII